MGFIFSVLIIAAMIFTLVNIIASDSSQIRHLDKTFWVIIVILIPLVGMIVFWLVGKEYGSNRQEVIPFGDPRRFQASTPQPHEDSEAEIDAAVLREIEFHEREAQIRRLEAEVRAKRGEA